MSGLRKLSSKFPPLDPLPLRPGLALVQLARYKTASQLTTAPPFAATPRRTLLPSTTTTSHSISHHTFRTYATKPGQLHMPLSSAVPISACTRLTPRCSNNLGKMGVTKTTHQEGSGAQPQNGQTVTIEYTGFLKDTSKPGNKGKQYVVSLSLLLEATICVQKAMALTLLSLCSDLTAPLAAVTLSLRLALARSSRVRPHQSSNKHRLHCLLRMAC